MLCELGKVPFPLGPSLLCKNEGTGLHALSVSESMKSMKEGKDGKGDGTGDRQEEKEEQEREKGERMSY